VKLLADLFACQTDSRFRGIGRYTLSLMLEMAKLRGTHEMFVLANADYPEALEYLRQKFVRLLPRGAFLPYRHRKLQDKNLDERECIEVAKNLVRQAYEVMAPDVVVYPSIFEGLGERGVVPLPDNDFPTASRAAILYDFIPYIFQEQFLNANPGFRRIYFDQLHSLEQFDILLAISESTRQDAIRLFNLNPEKIVNISSATSPQFKIKNYSSIQAQSILHRYGILKPFILFSANVEYHKNINGALEAFLELPEDILTSHQIVLTRAGDETALRQKIRSLGLSDDTLVITGHIPDEHLIALYNLCKLFFYPSLYEGFGLPVLEAMACGAPVIASNNSSLPEIVGWEDAMFDASDKQAVGSALYHAITDDAFRKELIVRGQQRVKLFSWERTARQAWDAIEAMGTNRKHAEYNVPSNLAQPLKRIAFVSPLPPQKSGISDYSAELLPYLAKHFQIDLFVEPGLDITDSYLRSSFGVFPWTELGTRKDDYETVVYQFGNSSFHSHMFALEQQFPGVVVLHDFYLGHLMAHIWAPKGLLAKKMDENHGLRGVIEYWQKGNESVWDLPVNWRVLRDAKEVIVHSKFHIELLRQHWGGGWKPTPTIIPQLHSSPPPIQAGQRLAIRAKLGVSDDKFLFCAFGLLTPEKYNLLTIQAFKKAHDVLGSDVLLFFVGDFVSQQHKLEIEELLAELNLQDHVFITGHISREKYDDYLISTDVAVQLRSKSRGETSRAVLDCMAYGVATIVNAHATFDDYSEEDVVKLPDLLSVDELAQAMIQLKNDQTFRAEKGLNAQRFVAREHAPENIAAAYAKVIHRAIRADDRKLFSPLLDSMRQTGNMDEILISEARLAATNLNLRSQPRILIDVTNISYLDLRTGVQRVVKNLIRELFLQENRATQFELVRLSEGQLLRSGRFTEKNFDLPEQCLGPDIPVGIRPGDVLFMLDTSWNLYDKFSPIFEQLRQLGGRILTMVYDLIPIKHPELIERKTANMFREWLNDAIAQSDDIVCISRSVADELVSYINDQKVIPLHHLDISYVHLGADIPLLAQETGIRDDLHKMLLPTGSSLFLMVGTVEPRKGHSFALDAFETLWEQGYEYHLCIAGKIGWQIEETTLRLRNHPELGKRLFFIENPTDAEINRCYSFATALIAASTAEGFGLPIVEAALHHVPVLASDIPVFHEVGGTGAMYFSLESPAYLAESIIAMSKLTKDERLAMAKEIRVLTWKESAAWMLEILDGKRKYITLPND
jgi:glycosyltransferase involved in cell wall biosynthesis